MIITLCGSTKFRKEYLQWNKDLTLAGHVVLSVGSLPHSSEKREWYSEDEKTLVDLVHFNKIAISDAIVILNVDGYIGKSTRREILYAQLLGKNIYSIANQYFQATGYDLTLIGDASQLLDTSLRKA